MGYSVKSVRPNIRQGSLSIKMLFALNKNVGIEFRDMYFIDDPAYRIVAQIYGHPDEFGGLPFGKAIEEVRDYFANGLDKDKIRDILIEKGVPLKTTKVKSIPMTVPKTTLTHSAVSEAFDEVANSEKKTLGNVISECTENLVVLDFDDRPPVYVSGINFEEYLKNKETKAAQVLANSVVEYFERWSKVTTTVNSDISLRLDKTETPVMQREYLEWTVVRDICRNTGIVTKARPWLEVLYFMMSSCVGIASRKEWEKVTNIIKFELSKESDFIGQYSIKKEEETNNDENV